MKRVLIFFGRLDRGVYPAIFLAAALGTLEGFGVLLISSTVLNRLAAGDDFSSILRLTVLMTAGYGLLRWLWRGAAWLCTYRINRFCYRYQQHIVKRCFQVPYRRLEEESFVELMDQIRQNEQIYQLESNILFNLHAVVKSAFFALAALLSFVRLFGVMQSLGDASFLASILILLLLLLIIFSTAYIVWRKKQNAGIMMNLTEELVKGNKVGMYLLEEVIVRYPLGKHIRLYGMKDMLLLEEQKNFDGQNEVVAHFQRLEMKPNLAGDVSSVAVSGLIYLAVSVVAMAGGLGVGSIIWYAGVVQRFLDSIRQTVAIASQLYSDCMRQQVMFRLEEAAEDASGGDAHIPSAQSHELELEDVSFSYPGSDRTVLSHVNLKISGTERIALVGRNGCGKSTLIKLICRLYEPTGGRILLDGVDIREIPFREYAGFLSVVFQDYCIFAATLAENISFSEQAERARAQAATARIGLGIEELDTPLRRDLEENGVEVSGGEGQKIAIARALYKDAPTVILDEPTASLDPISESEIYEKLNMLVDGKLSLFISHRLSSCRFCDRILVLENGNIAQDGNHEMLAAQEGLYREMWEAQKQYYVQQPENRGR
ncbi:MAG: ABC transporter ATP-binding protein/permease [Lachnospiraceae bacterium]|nr:ABC transporter ATP-binding protein/permease [Lachnospiraceae bacterium]